MHAFLRYEQGHRQAAVRRALLRSATTRLARALLTRPARGSARAPEGRLLRLSLYGPFGRYVKASAQIAYPGLGEALVELSLHHRAGRWRVARVRP